MVIGNINKAIQGQHGHKHKYECPPLYRGVGGLWLIWTGNNTQDHSISVVDAVGERLPVPKFMFIWDTSNVILYYAFLDTLNSTSTILIFDVWRQPTNGVAPSQKVGILEYTFSNHKLNVDTDGVHDVNANTVQYAAVIMSDDQYEGKERKGYHKHVLGYDFKYACKLNCFKYFGTGINDVPMSGACPSFGIFFKPGYQYVWLNYYVNTIAQAGGGYYTNRGTVNPSITVADALYQKALDDQNGYLDLGGVDDSFNKNVVLYHSLWIDAFPSGRHEKTLSPGHSHTTFTDLFTLSCYMISYTGDDNIPREIDTSPINPEFIILVDSNSNLYISCPAPVELVEMAKNGSNNVDRRAYITYNNTDIQLDDIALNTSGVTYYLIVFDFDLPSKWWSI